MASLGWPKVAIPVKPMQSKALIRKKSILFSGTALPLGSALLAVQVMAPLSPAAAQQASGVTQGTAAPLAPGAQVRIEPKLRPRTPMLTQAQFSQATQGLKAAARGAGQPGALAAPSSKGGAPTPAPADYGASCANAGLPPGCVTYSTARVANSTVNGSATTAAQPVGGMPYVATGKLLIATTTAGVFNSWCSASLVGKGVLVTAAHCVHDYGRGSAGFVKSLRFIPAQNSSTTNAGPYGFWDAQTWWIPTAYFNGTDTCSVRGIVCNNDVAVVLLRKNSANQYPWGVSQIYYYSYGWNGYGFRPEGSSGTRRGQITQLGYPGGLDSGRLMQRNDSQGQYLGTGTGASPRNIVMGSRMDGGSSGGPWLVNFGTTPTASGAPVGAAPVFNVVQGTSSWGYTNTSIKIVGASTFAQNPQFPNASYIAGGRNYGAGNIGALMSSVCGPAPGSNGQALGACF
jgi:hypothetical protein